MIKKIKGFTLIELLVVIAIIGILSAVVIGNLNDARNSGKDASAKATMSSVRAQAEVFYDGNSGSYTGVCTDASITSLFDGVDTAIGATGSVTCGEAATGMAASVELLSGDGFFCVDSTGYAGLIAGTTDPVAGATDIACN